MIADLLTSLLAANLAGAAAILAVLALRPLVRPRFGARATYALWAAPAVAALAAAIPHRGASVAAAPFVATAEAATRALPHAATHGGLVPGLLLATWLIGVVVTAAVLARRQRAFERSLGRLTPTGKSVARAAQPGVSPAVVGLIRPCIVTPADFDQRFAADERILILAHEGAHLAGGDAAVNALACAFQCVGWFNPLVHVAVRALRIDQELACDAAVIDRFPEARKTYAELLLRTQLAAQAPPLGCQWPASGAHPLKERIAMLKSALPPRDMRTMGLAVAALLGLGAAGLAWTASAAAPAAITQPDWAAKPVGADIADVYPAEALKAKLGGQATIGCGVSSDGLLTGCKVLAESPADAGFGAAALKLSERFKMKPKTKDGHPVAGGVVRIPIRFMVPEPKPTT